MNMVTVSKLLFVIVLFSTDETCEAASLLDNRMSLLEK